MLTELIGVYEMKEIWRKYVQYGFSTDTAFYPLGIPLTD